MRIHEKIQIYACSTVASECNISISYSFSKTNISLIILEINSVVLEIHSLNDT